MDDESFDIIKSIINASTFYDLRKTFANVANLYFIESQICKIMYFTIQNLDVILYI